MNVMIRISGEVGAIALLPFSRVAISDYLNTMISVLPEILASNLRGIDLYILRDGGIALANRSHMECLGPTNVLSFPGGPDMAGSLLLSVDTLLRESTLYGQNSSQHCIRLLAHGMGHLLGYDHGEEMNTLCTAMERAALDKWKNCPL